MLDIYYGFRVASFGLFQVVSCIEHKKTRDRPTVDPGYEKDRRRPTLPLGFPSSTIGAKELNFRVRDGNGCRLFAIATENYKSSFVFVFSVLWVVVSRVTKH